MNHSNLFLRTVSAVIAAPLAVYLVLLGDLILLVLVSIIAMMAARELDALFDGIGARPFRSVAYVLSLLVLWSTHVPMLLMIALGVGILAYLLLPLLFFDEKTPLRLGTTALVPLITGLLPSYLLRLRAGAWQGESTEQAVMISIMLLIFVWVADSGAYFAGRTLGKTPLAPVISPKKTWEGYIGGALAVSLVAFLASLFWLGDRMPISILVGLVIICGLIAPFGDLTESALKRTAGVKDSGVMLPGHGGVLDRIDSILIAFPLAYLFLYLVD